MTKEELIQFLKDNLSVQTDSAEDYYTVAILLGQEKISEDIIWINGEHK